MIIWSNNHQIITIWFADVFQIKFTIVSTRPLWFIFLSRHWFLYRFFNLSIQCSIGPPQPALYFDIGWRRLSAPAVVAYATSVYSSAVWLCLTSEEGTCVLSCDGVCAFLFALPSRIQCTAARIEPQNMTSSHDADIWNLGRYEFIVLTMKS